MFYVIQHAQRVLARNHLGRTIYIPVLDNIRKTKQQKTKEHMKYSYMYVYTRMIFAEVLSPTIKIFHRHLGPNL
jgi:hypothetical protein